MEQRPCDRPGELAPEFAERLFRGNRVIGQNARQLGNEARQVALLGGQPVNLGAFFSDALTQGDQQALAVFERGVEPAEFVVPRLCEAGKARLFSGNL